MCLGTLLRRVVTCCDMLGVVGLNLKTIKFLMQHSWMLRDFVVIWTGSCNNFAPGHAHQFDFQLATCETMLRTFRSVAIKCCDKCCNRLAGACKCRVSYVGKLCKRRKNLVICFISSVLSSVLCEFQNLSPTFSVVF